MTDLVKFEPNKLAKPQQTFNGIMGQAVTPLAGWTEQNEFRYRFPREGKIHLGVKVKKQTQRGEVEFPTATDYFVLPEKLQTDQAFRAVLEGLGEDPDKPRKLPVWLPSNNLSENVVSSYDRYSKTHGLQCRSIDGITRICSDGKGAYQEGPCDNVKCVYFAAEKPECVVIHRLRVFLPDAQGVGIWQVDTKSGNSWGNLMTEMKTISMTSGGHIAGLDLYLTLEPQSMQVPVKDKQGGTSTLAKDVWLMHIRSAVTLRNMQAEVKAAQGRVNWSIDEVASVDLEYDEVVMDPQPAEKFEDWEGQPSEHTEDAVDQETGEVTPVPHAQPEPQDTEAQIAAELDAELETHKAALSAVLWRALLSSARIVDLNCASTDQKTALVELCRKRKGNGNNQEAQ